MSALVAVLCGCVAGMQMPQQSTATGRVALAALALLLAVVQTKQQMGEQKQLQLEQTLQSQQTSAQTSAQSQQTAAQSQQTSAQTLQWEQKMVQLQEQQSRVLQSIRALVDCVKTRVCNMEWRSMLSSEAEWAEESLQTAYRRWQTGTRRMPPDAGVQTSTLDCGALLGHRDEQKARAQLSAAAIAEEQTEWQISLEAEHALEEIEEGKQTTPWQTQKQRLQTYEDAVQTVAQGGRVAAEGEWQRQGRCALQRMEGYLQLDAYPPAQTVQTTQTAQTAQPADQPAPP
ncbi:MAG: hypothetical protein GY772_28160 [bacterium]|nr:hypothetical protein [bacterium]